MTPDSPPELIDELQSHAITSATAEPDADISEFAPLGEALTDVNVVGLGEATHRTREFVRLKHRLIRYLVERRGYRLFGLEAPFSETVELHEFVFHGAGDLEDVLETIGFSIYETAETRELFRWMRAFNEGRPPSDRIAVYGFDVQSAAGAAAALREFLGRGEDPGLLADLETIAGGVFEGGDVDRDRLELAEEVGSKLKNRFATDRVAQFDSSEGHLRQGGTDLELARQHLRTLQRACTFARTGLEAGRTEQYGVRDRYMARTIAWILGYDTADEIVVWAHNNHVKRGRLTRDGYPSESMGDHLADRYGDRYYALGLQFGGGTVRPLVPTDDDPEFEFDSRGFVRTEVPVPEPAAGSVPDAFSRLDEQVVVLDYRSLPPDGSAREWLDEPRSHHYVAGSVDPDDRTSFYRDHRSLRAFDGLAFVRDVEPSTPL